MKLRESESFDQSIRLLHEICRISHPTHDFNASGGLFANASLQQGLRTKNTAAIYDWLMMVFSYQGISDKAVETILSRDGNATFRGISNSLKPKSRCSKLTGFWTFEGCGFSKGNKSCNCPNEIKSCALPQLPLRNGSLNQLAYSLYFFMRDVASGDFLGWLDDRVRECEGGTYLDIERELIAPMRTIHGISDKVISMALSDLLMASASNPHWRRLGADFVVIDRLVHNFMHRSGILLRHNCEHPYGPACYGDDGCAALLLSLSRGIDVRRYHHSFPQPFPRFVQTAVWRYCATMSENICNGNQIDDRRRCRSESCKLQSFCERIALRHRSKTQ